MTGFVSDDFFKINGSPLHRACLDVGYNTVEDFIYRNPQELKLFNGVVFAVLKESSAHVQKLIDQQKKKTNTRVCF